MRPNPKTAAIFLSAVLFFSAAYAAPRNPSLKQPQEILVEFKKNPAAQDISALAARQGNEPGPPGKASDLLAKIYGMTQVNTDLENVPFACFKLSDPSKMDETISALKKESVVLSVQPNYLRYALYTPQAQPDDPIYRKVYAPQPAAAEWGFAMINADTAYNAGLINQLPAREIIVAVVDTGIKTDHPDIAGMTITGRNIIDPLLDPFDDDDSGGHGSHSAGIIGANTGNSIGIAGTAYTNSTWTARVLLMPVKVLDSHGSGDDARAAAGIKWAADNGANVINLSFGGPDQSDVLQDAVNYAFLKGCVLVAAAGNNGTQVWYPAACANVISVAATDITDQRATFSNYGKIDVSAPGVDIWSCTNTVPAYNSEDGTSFAAPFVSGLAAMIMLKYQGLKPDQVRTIIERSAADIGAPGYDIYTGWGRIDMAKALNQDFKAEEKSNTYNWPNPFSPGMDLFTNIVFQLPSPADAVISVYDAGGDLVWKKEIAAAQTTAGSNTEKWDGRNTAGKIVANGTYFYVIKTASGGGKNKIVVIH